MYLKGYIYKYMCVKSYIHKNKFPTRYPLDTTPPHPHKPYPTHNIAVPPLNPTLPTT